jgi:hypothetical protein
LITFAVPNQFGGWPLIGFGMPLGSFVVTIDQFGEPSFGVALSSFGVHSISLGVAPD